MNEFFGKIYSFIQEYKKVIFTCIFLIPLIAFTFYLVSSLVLKLVNKVKRNKQRKELQTDTNNGIDTKVEKSFEILKKKITGFVKFLDPKDTNNPFVRQTIINFFNSVFGELSKLSTGDLNYILINSCCSKTDKEFEVSDSFYNSEQCDRAMAISSNFEILVNLKLQKGKIFETKAEEATFYNYFRIFIESLIKNEIDNSAKEKNDQLIDKIREDENQ